jgi:5'(3')-deoxyribonucleotidase
MSKKIIAIDLDEVLSPFVLPLVDWHNKVYETAYHFEQFVTYDFSEIWGGTKENTVLLCDKFHNSRHIDDIHPVQGAQESLNLLKQQFDLVLVTSRPSQHREYTLAWINRHLPNIFSDVVLCNHWTNVGVAIKKSEVCQKINAQYFIDDLPFYVEDVANCGIQSFLFGDYPWNRAAQIIHPNVKRVSSWTEIVNLLSPMLVSG